MGTLRFHSQLPRPFFLCAVPLIPSVQETSAQPMGESGLGFRVSGAGHIFLSFLIFSFGFVPKEIAANINEFESF